MQRNGVDKECINCQKTFYAKLSESSRKYCSYKCYWEFKTGKPMSNREGSTLPCKTCGKDIYRAQYQLKNKTGSFCSPKCYWKFRKGYNSRENHPNWKGGRYHAHGGYFRVHDGDKLRYEHIVIMEKHLGRKLKKNERVHHIDFNPSNNNIDNLIVMTHAEHIKYHKSYAYGKGFQA